MHHRDENECQLKWSVRRPDGSRADRYVSDFDCHVYYPREVELLFRLTGFRVEAWFGDYAMRALGRSSRQLIGVGVKSAAPTANHE
jgi:hypothetical protein